MEKITFTRQLARQAVVSVYFMGYRKDVPFAAMPKMRIVIGSQREEVFNQLVPAPGAGVTVTRKDLEVTKFAAPLRGLGYPEKLMTSARSYLDDVPLDWMSWRVIENLPQEPR